MSTVQVRPGSRAGAPRRLAGFVRDRFPAHVYLSYGLLWTLAMAACAGRRTGAGWPAWPTLVAMVVTVALTLLFLRVVDDQKDLAHDRDRNPDRPLVTGAVTGADLRAAAAFLIVAVLAVNAAVSLAATATIAIVWGYALLLVALDRVPIVRNRESVALAAGYFVQALTNVYLYRTALAGRTGTDARMLPLLAVFALLFLHFELARKITAYAAAWGRARAVGIAAGCAAGAVALTLAVFRPGPDPLDWLPLLALVPAGIGTLRYRRKGGSWPMPFAMVFVAVLLASLIAGAGTTGR
jgi:4-hydroxybenzoate polyprenyltransferase